MHVQDVLPRDAIPSIDDPAFGPDYFGDPSDAVLVVEGAPARAYPIRILSSTRSSTTASRGPTALTDRSP